MIMDHLKRLGQRIARIRKIKKITQEELAERSNLTMSYISKIETGKKNPTMAVIEKIADGLGMDTCQLFTNLEPELMSSETMLKKIGEMINILEARGCYGQRNKSGN